MNTNKNEVFAYIRVSTVKQGEGVSLEVQQEAIEKYAQQQNLNVIEWFEEQETAAKQGRPIFNGIIKRLHQKKAGGLVMHKIDRSARNLRDWATVGELQDHGIEVHFAAESVDFASRGGRLTADIQAVIAADYIRNLREEALKGMCGRLKQGLYPWKAPIGYIDNGGGKAKTIDPVRGPLIRSAFQLYASGEFSTVTLTDEMHNRGLLSDSGKPVSQTGIENILKNPFYMGHMHIKSRNETYRGIHEPLISANLFQTVQDIKAGRNIKKKTKHRFTYRSLFQCSHCNKIIIAERQKGHIYYRCHTRLCETKTIRENEIENQMSLKLSTLAISPPALTCLEDSMTQWLTQKRQTRQNDTTSMELEQIRARKDKMIDILSDDLIDKSTYAERMKRLLVQESKVLDKRKNQASHGYNQQNADNFLELIKSLNATYFLANSVEKRQMVKILFSNRMVIGKNLELEPKNWVIEVQNLVSTLVGPPDCGNGRSGQELSEATIKQIDDLINSEEVQEAINILKAGCTKE